jgi:OOP family OmpA-OmpF porin
MKKSFLYLVLMAFTNHSFAQAGDTLIYAQGKIVNALTKESVSGKISYQSLPYGNKVGMLSGSDYRTGSWLCSG